MQKQILAIIHSEKVIPHFYDYNETSLEFPNVTIKFSIFKIIWCFDYLETSSNMTWKDNLQTEKGIWVALRGWMKAKWTGSLVKHMSVL